MELSASARAFATTSGSGLSKARRIKPATMYAAAARMNGPARAGTPIDSANFPITLTKFGPATAPNVVETIAMLIAVAR
ncbi:hypothetical protein D3C71_1590070 [compost metagenome]